MNILQLNSFVREKSGVPSSLLKSDAITLNLLSEIVFRQSQMMSAGKALRQKIETTTLTAKTGAVDPSILAGKARQPEYARVKVAGSNAFDLLTIVGDLDALVLAESNGEYAILFYDAPLKYLLSWTPPDSGDEFEFWIDADVSTLCEVASAGTLLPPRFDFLIGIGATIKSLPGILLHDAQKSAFVNLQIQVLEHELARFEAEWSQFLYQSVSAGQTMQKARFRGRQSRRLRRFPY